MTTAPPLVSTYRLQLTGQFGFDAAAEIVPYLKSLGISHLYASPIFKARPGSTHGYDILDHTAFNPELGGEAAFHRLSDALARAEMGLIVDFVPNHMCVEGARNEWWWNALEFGPKGRHAPHFDVDWRASPGRPRILLPVLGKPYADALRDGEIQLRYAEGAFFIRYFDHTFPIRPHSYAAILRALTKSADKADAVAGLSALALDVERNRHREQKAATLKEQSRTRLSQENTEAVLASYNARTDPEAADRLHRLLDRQHYRLAHWRLAGSQINYRRFFDINSLAGLRVEREETFQALHPLIARLLGEGRLHGLRVDHIDGLLDPAGYCAKLQELFRATRRKDIYLVVEKILGEGEHLPPWPGVAGTTGYEWMNVISRTLVDAEGLKRLQGCWQEISPSRASFDETLRSAKRQVLHQLFAGEFDVLARLLIRIAAGHRTTRDLPSDHLRELLREYIVEFPIYRTYAAANAMSVADRRIVDQTLARVRQNDSRFGSKLLDFMREALTLDLIRRRSGHSKTRVRRFATKLQQLTGPVMAKSLEDTALYRDHRLIALNEVGNDPSLPALDADDFHSRMEKRVRDFPHGLTATSTHDTKRGEDARMRVLAIAELADEWGENVRKWIDLNARHVRIEEGQRIPSIEHEYLLYQAMIGAWPHQDADETFADRLGEFAVKAAREGKIESSWLEPNRNYEAGLQQFVTGACDRKESADFIASFHAFASRCALIGALYSLSQLTLKAMMPGIPDFYRGTEGWDFSFVDPDNRRPVSFSAFDAAAKRTAQDGLNDLIDEGPNGPLKLALTARLLAFRQSQPLLFTEGGYTSLESRKDTIAFARLGETTGCAIAVVCRFAEHTKGGLEWPRSFGSDHSICLPPNWGVQETLVGERVERTATVIPMRTLGRLPVCILQLVRNRAI